jgi:toxin ParE1/3/4
VTKPIRPNEFAEDEIEYYIRRYEGESPGLGDQLWIEIQEATELISRYPQIGSFVPRVRIRGGVRRFPLHHFPFVLVYREHEEHVEIVALAHTSRKPSYWRSRLRRDRS